MKKKERATAKTQTPKERAENKRLRRKLAQFAALHIRNALTAFGRARFGRAADSDEKRAMNDVKKSWFLAGLLISCGYPDPAEFDPAKFLRLVAEALDGKFHVAKYDDAIHEAHRRAVRTGKRRDERDSILCPFPSELYDAFKQNVAEQWERTEKPSRVPHKDAMIRRAKILGYDLSEKPGRHRKTFEVGCRRSPLSVR